MHFFSPEYITNVVANWGYVGIFICVFVGNLGVPVPEETVILAAGFLAGQDVLDIKRVYAVAVMSAIAGDSAGFVLGRIGGQPLLERLARSFAFARQRYDRLQVFFHRHGNKAVFMARFVTGARFLAGPMAGAAGMQFTRFLGWNVLGALVWCAVVLALGYLVIDEIYQLSLLAHAASLLLAAAAVVLMLGIWLGVRALRRRQAAQANSGRTK